MKINPSKNPKTLNKYTLQIFQEDSRFLTQSENINLKIPDFLYVIYKIHPIMIGNSKSKSVDLLDFIDQDN